MEFSNVPEINCKPSVRSAHSPKQEIHTFTLPPPPQTELDASKNELASQRIAFEEEKLARLEGDAGLVPDSEAEALRIKLKQQVSKN